MFVLFVCTYCMPMTWFYWLCSSLCSLSFDLSCWPLQTFLVHSKEDQGMTLSVRLPDEQGAPLVHNLMVKQHKTCMWYTLVQLLLLRATFKASYSGNTKYKTCMADNTAEQLVIHSWIVFCLSCTLRQFLSPFWWHLQTDLLLLCQQVTYIRICAHNHECVHIYNIDSTKNQKKSCYTIWTQTNSTFMNTHICTMKKHSYMCAHIHTMEITHTTEPQTQHNCMKRYFLNSLLTLMLLFINKSTKQGHPGHPTEVTPGHYHSN